MKSLDSKLTESRPIDPRLEQIIESAANRLQEGQSLDLEQLAAEHPQFAGQLRELLPAMAMLVRLGDTRSHSSVATLQNGHGPAPPYERLGDFRLVREIGRGGMGVVYEAEQLSMGRRVALKVLPFAALLDEKALQRFRNEVRAAAALDHPNIVAVYSVGEQQGVHFYAMQLVRGSSLAEVIAQLKNHVGAASSIETQPVAALSTIPDVSSPEFFLAAARLGIQAAEAVQHAHDQGVLHRDIKPSNLMLDNAAKLYVTDFGLARFDADVGLTMTGDILGTLRYMAPEQALAKRVVIDHRADVYSLGATLYEFLTLQPTFEVTDRTELLNHIAFTEPRSMRAIDRRIPAELETIVLKAMAKNREDRYQTSQQLADDLVAFCEHRPIMARPISLADRARKWARRHQALVTTAGVALAVLCVIFAISTVIVTRAQNQVVAALEETSELLYTTDMTLAFQTYEKGWTDEVQTILDRYLPREQGSDRRGFEWHLLQSLVEHPASVTLAGHTGPVTELAVFPDRRRLASVGEDGTLRIWDVGRQSLVRTIPLCNEGLSSVAVSPDGRFVAAGSTDAYFARMRLAGTEQEGTITAADKSTVVYLCDLEADCSVSQVFQGGPTVESLAFSPDGAHLAVGTRYDEVCLVTLNGEVVKRIPCTSRIDSLDYMARSSTVLVPNRIPRRSGQNAYLQLWNGDLSKVNRAVFYPSEKNSDITIARTSPCENYLFAGDHSSSNLFLFHLPSQRVVAEVPAFRDNLIDLAYSPDGKSLAAGYRNGTVQLLKVDTSSDAVSVQPESIFKAHIGEVLCTRFLSSNEVATCGSDGLIRIWNNSRAADRESGAPGEFWEGPRVVPWTQRLLNGANIGIRLSPDGSQFLYSASNGILGIDSRTGTVIQDHAVPSSGSSEWSTSGDQIALFFKGEVARFEVVDRTGETMLAIPRELPPRAAAFSPAGDLVALIDDRELQIYSVRDGSDVLRRPISGSGLSIAFSHDGTTLAYGGQFPGVQVVDPQSASIPRSLAGGWNANHLAFSPDDSLLAAAHGDGVVRLWDTSTWHLQAELVGHENSVRDIAFSPDGRTLISASTDGAIRLWSVECASCFGTLYTQLAECRISLSANGRHFAIAYHNHDGKPEVLIWHTTRRQGAESCVDVRK